MRSLQLLAILFLLCAGLLPACSPVPLARPAQSIRSAAPEPSATTSANGASPEVEPSSPPSAVPSQPECRSNGTVEEDVVPDGGSFGRDLPFLIYLPPCYGLVERGWPTLYLLHGLAGSADDWIDMGIAAAADRVIGDGSGDGFLIVMPWQRSGLEFEPALMQGLLPQIESDYGGLPGRTWRAIGGISRGGGWAFRIGFRYPATFSSIGLHSPAVAAGDLAALPRWLSLSSGQRTAQVWIDIGDADSLLANADELRAQLAAQGVAYEYTVGEGGHNAAYWSTHLDEYLAWYGRRW